LVFNIQDVFPDAAIATGKITNKRVIGLARWLERTSYRASDAVVVLSQDLQKNLEAKVSPKVSQRVHVIANFVDSENIVPRSTSTAYRKEHAGNADTVVMYAGNVGFSQSIHLLIDAARALPRVMFIVNGEGSARSELEAQAAGVFNIRFVNYQDASRLSEVLASADVHVVPLKTGLGAVSVPSKAYSIMAAGRPLLAAIDADSEVARIVENVGCGRVVAPDQPEAFIAALSSMLENRDEMAEMGAKGRLWVVKNASPHAVGEAYHQLLATLSPVESL
jgi:colanic acid biosynthesis glycosyl transferase WcaI